jgi:hypothetical protein
VKLTDLKEIEFLFLKTSYPLEMHSNDVQTRIRSYYTPRFHVISDILCEESKFDQFLCPNFRDSMGRLCFKSSQTTQLGSYNCGTKHCSTPIITESEPVFANSTSNTGTSQNRNFGENGNFGDILYKTKLLELIITMRERITDPDTGLILPDPNGRLDNLREYVNLIFMHLCVLSHVSF